MITKMTKYDPFVKGWGHSKNNQGTFQQKFEKPKSTMGKFWKEREWVGQKFRKVPINCIIINIITIISGLYTMYSQISGLKW